MTCFNFKRAAMMNNVGLMLKGSSTTKPQTHKIVSRETYYLQTHLKINVNATPHCSYPQTPQTNQTYCELIINFK